MGAATAAEDDGAGLTRRHDLALALVALLILLDQLLVQPPLWRLASDAPVINLAGRQRMLSQRLAKAALELELARRSPTQDPGGPAAELRAVAAAWSREHEALLRGDPARAIPGPAGGPARDAWRGIDPAFRAIRSAAGRLADPSRPGPTEVRGAAQGLDPDVAQILALEDEYLGRMDRVVGVLEAEARGRVATLRRVGWALAGAEWLGLVAVGWAVIRPAARATRRRFEVVRDARGRAEAEVRDRTAALERAIADLRREADGRLRAQDEHRALVERFGHLARASAVGEMATTLAHEINQPLAAAANYLEGCLVALDAAGPATAQVREATARALDAVHRAGQVVHRVRRFVRRRAALVERFEAGAVVEEVGALLGDEARRRGVGLRVALAPGLPPLSGDPVQVQQVLVNLVRNALDAARPPDPVVALEATADAAGGVAFRVVDNGEGIAAADLARVFEPYYSTRADGMGMGLAISRTIVEAHGGRLAVESEPGRRTIFLFTLPPAGE